MSEIRYLTYLAITVLSQSDPFHINAFLYLMVIHLSGNILS